MEPSLIATLAALIGISLLLFLSNVVEPPLSEIASLSIADLDNFVKVEGIVSEFRHGSQTTFFTVTDQTASIEAVSRTRLALKKGDLVQVIGKLVSRERKLLIEVSKVKRT